MDTLKIKSNLEAFIRRHRRSFESLVARETALLEMAALVMTSEHYRLVGYSIGIENDKRGFFSVKLSARGHPYNFSWFTCVRSDAAFEIHCNLAVGGAHGDGAVYVVDVAVVRPGIVPRARNRRPWICVNNTDLVTFVEVKKLVVYPMLLAQFVGIVHEIKPAFLHDASCGLEEYDHFYPSLLTLGYLKGTSSMILDGFIRRNYKICVVHNFEAHLSSMRAGIATTSPFESRGNII
jgi:hypothetical protein